MSAARFLPFYGSALCYYPAGFLGQKRVGSSSKEQAPCDNKARNRDRRNQIAVLHGCCWTRSTGGMDGGLGLWPLFSFGSRFHRTKRTSFHSRWMRSSRSFFLAGILIPPTRPPARRKPRRSAPAPILFLASLNALSLIGVFGFVGGGRGWGDAPFGFSFELGSSIPFAFHCLRSQSMFPLLGRVGTGLSVATHVLKHFILRWQHRTPRRVLHLFSRFGNKHPPPPAPARLHGAPPAPIVTIAKIKHPRPPPKVHLNEQSFRSISALTSAFR